MQRLIDLGYAARRWLLAVLRWPSRGVKVMAFDAAGRVLLIRNRYGNAVMFVLPGGGVGLREDFVDAAVRELVEETGLTLGQPRRFARYSSAAEGKRDTIELFVGQVSGAPKIDPREVAEARFVSPDQLPEGTSPATRRRIVEVVGGAAPADTW